MKRRHFWAGMLIGAACIAYVVSTIKDPQNFVHALRSANLLYLIPITASYFFLFALRVLRWQFILRYSGRAGFRNGYSALMIGYMGNNIFPLRAGEVMRALVIGKREPAVSYSGALASVLVERLYDVFMVALSLAIVLMVIEFPEGGLPIMIGETQYDLAETFRGFGKSVLTGSVLLFAFLVLLNVRTKWVLEITGRALAMIPVREARDRTDAERDPRPPRWRRSLMAGLERFGAGLNIMGRPRDLFLLLVMSVIIWAVNLLPVWLSGLALDEIGSMSLKACAFMLVAGSVAASIPGPPGFFGIYHAFNQAAMLFYLNHLGGSSINPETALFYAVILHGCYYFPVTAAGAVLAWLHGYSLTKLRQDAQATGKSPKTEVPLK